MKMTINKAIGEAAPRLNYNQTTQANQLTNIKAIRDELLLVADHANCNSGLCNEVNKFLKGFRLTMAS